MRFKWGFDEEDSGCKELKLELLQQIMALRRYYQVTRFMVACDPGVGLYSAEAIRVLRESDDEMMLFCVTPHEEQATKWAPYLRERYFSMLESCTYLSAACKEKTPTRQLEAYKCIISSSDIVLAVYDPASFRNDDVDKAMAFAAKKKKPVILIHPDSLEVSRYPGKLQP
jgi:uncharacterized phage-like protein YoqJ